MPLELCRRNTPMNRLETLAQWALQTLVHISSLAEKTTGRDNITTEPAIIILLRIDLSVKIQLDLQEATSIFLPTLVITRQICSTRAVWLRKVDLYRFGQPQGPHRQLILVSLYGTPSLRFHLQIRSATQSTIRLTVLREN